MRIVTVVGARPQFVKAAAVSAAISATVGVDEVLVHTGQHYDVNMSDVFFTELAIPEPRFHLGIGSGGHGRQTGEMMGALEPIVEAERPDAVMVYGDTNSTLAAALVAAKLHVPVVHVEAGLRSFDRRMPEETNRVLTDHVSASLLCPSERSVANLRAEGIVDGVALVGDVMLDVLRVTLAATGEANPAADRLGVADGPYAVFTMHRAALTDDPVAMERVLGAIDRIAVEGVRVVFPVHPRVRSSVGARPFAPGVMLVDPLGYRDMLTLIRRARAVITDSGGLQKEAAWVGTPCITIRDTTEWVETLETGWNVLVDTDAERIVTGTLGAVAPPVPFTAYGTGEASRLVVAELLRLQRERGR